jgi:holo-[acyl-carrier protein] synthase
LIFGTGIDIIEVDRVGKQVAENKGFREQIFTAREIKYCEARRSKAQNYAVRFAAKEAFFKALGTGWRCGLAWNEVEVINNRLGKPEMIVHGKVKKYTGKKKISGIHVSLSHINNFANAFVIIEKL